MMEGYGFPYVWEWRRRAPGLRSVPDRRAVPGRVRGTMNSALVEFEDGYRSRYQWLNGIRLASTVRDVRT
jgi:hypothetical protein